MADLKYYDVILKPVVSEVESVNTMNLEGKTKRRGRTSGKTSKTKKAIVKLTADSKDIEIFEGLQKEDI